MTDLTDKWKKGELPSGWYYINSSYYANGSLMWCENGIFIASDNVVPTERITEILEPVPSYEKFDNIIKCYLCAHEKVDRFEKENAQLKERLKKTQELELEVRRENTKLKELLKECREPLEVLAEKRDACDWYPEDVLAKLYQALGEDK